MTTAMPLFRHHPFPTTPALVSLTRGTKLRPIPPFLLSSTLAMFTELIFTNEHKQFSQLFLSKTTTTKTTHTRARTHTHTHTKATTTATTKLNKVDCHHSETISKHRLKRTLL